MSSHIGEAAGYVLRDYITDMDQETGEMLQGQLDGYVAEVGVENVDGDVIMQTLEQFIPEQEAQKIREHGDEIMMKV